jgi:hypothetical protein
MNGMPFLALSVKTATSPVVLTPSLVGSCLRNSVASIESVGLPTFGTCTVPVEPVGSLTVRGLAGTFQAGGVATLGQFRR